MATTTKRKPSPPRPVLYPRQLVIMLDDETADAIERLAAERLEPKGRVARDLIAAGLAIGGGETL